MPETIADTTDATTATTEPAELGDLGLFPPGAYTSDLLSLGLELETTEQFRLGRAHSGLIEIVSPDSSTQAYRGVAFMVVDTLIDSDVLGGHIARPAAAADLGDFLGSRDRMEIVDRRTEELGGLRAEVWRVGFTDPCDDCWFPVLLNTTGWENQWGQSPGNVQEFWSIDAPDTPIVIAVEAPEDSFDEWLNHVREHLFDGLEFGSPTGYSLVQPAGAFADGFGTHAVGRAELAVVDGSRPTAEVRDDIGLLVSASDQRRLLLSVAYPSDLGGFGAEPSDGSFPLVVVAPALFDASISLPADRQLASHGFVVVTIRFPESSFPGGAVAGVPQQPADVSFVIDEIERGALPTHLAPVTDIEHIGLIGHSAGATTAFGLLTSECCQDTRIRAVVAHAGTPFDFNSAALPSATPILHVVSDGDQQIEVDTIRALHDSTDGPSTLAVMSEAPHLEWLDPQSPQYDATFDLVLSFFDQHLRNQDRNLNITPDDSIFVHIDER